MSFDSSVDPNQLFMSISETLKATGLDRNQLKSAVYKKELDNVVVAGTVMFYRMEVARYLDARAKKESAHV